MDEGHFTVFFRADANPELLQIFNSGNDRAFAFVMRSIPLGNGEFEDHDFNTFAAMCFTSIAKLPTKSMQSRCIGLPMRPANKEEAARLNRFRADRAQDLNDCGRKFARWAADLSEPKPGSRDPGRILSTASPTTGAACFRSPILPAETGPRVFSPLL